MHCTLYFVSLVSLVPVDMLDENKRRLTPKELLKDHLTILELFKLTEVTYGLVLLVFYLIMVSTLDWAINYSSDF